jgi:hypothetical protein
MKLDKSIDLLLPLWHQTQKREKEQKTKSSLRFFFYLVVVIIFFGVAVPSPRVFHGWRRKRWVDDWLGGLKTHISVHLALALL